jgi:hypothetical protein
MINALHLFFAGLGGMSIDFVVGAALLAACAAGAIYSPLAKKDFVLAGCVILAALLFEARGIRKEHERVLAQDKVIEVVVDKAVAKTKTPKAKASKDRWDRKEY